MSYRYGWSELQVGLALAGVGVCSMIVQGALVRPIVKRLGERRSLAMGLLFGAAGFAIYAFATRGDVFLIGIPVMAIWGITGPATQALMTRHVSASEQGKLQGANSSITAIAGLVGPAMFTLVFASFIGARANLHLPGAPYLLAAAILLASCAIAWAATRQR
jgi:DHA1 family tetracycline resistance protein-like MFS transporter